MSNPFARVRGVFFDLDDTLCGYWDASKGALRAVFEDHPVPGAMAEQMVEHWAAAFREFSPLVKNEQWYPTYLKQGAPSRTRQMELTLARAGVYDKALARVVGDRYAELRNANLRLFDDALDVLNALHPSYTMGLITNGPADIQRQEIETLGIEPYFPFIYIEGEMGIGKPHPEVFERALSDTGLTAEEVVFVGNSYAHDIRPAIDQGWLTVWVRRDSDVPPSAQGMKAKPESKPADAPGPTETIGNLSELLGLLRR